MTAITVPPHSSHLTRTTAATLIVVLAIAIAAAFWAFSGGHTTHRATVEVGPLHTAPLVCHAGRPC